MEPLNDKELNQLLRQWEAPDAPATLRIPARPRVSPWQWLWSGRIHVPVPVGVLGLVLVAAIGITSFRSKNVDHKAPPVENSVHSESTPEKPKPEATPVAVPQPKVPSPELPSASESAALAGFRPVSQFEPKVIGVAK